MVNAALLPQGLYYWVLSMAFVAIDQHVLCATLVLLTRTCRVLLTASHGLAAVPLQL